MTEAELKAITKKLLTDIEDYLKLAGDKIDTRTKTFCTSLKAHAEHYLEPEKFQTTVTTNAGQKVDGAGSGAAPTQKPPTTG
jgi:hypothetical protein